MPRDNWEAESDARTMAESDAIKRDPERLNKATAASVELAKTAMDEAVSMNKIANQQTFAKSARSLGIGGTEQES